MKPNIDTFGPGVRKLNPKLFKSLIEHVEDGNPHPVIGRDNRNLITLTIDQLPKHNSPTVKESLSVRSTEESSAVQLSRNPLQLESKEEIKSEKQLQEQIASLLRNRGIVFQRSRMDRKTTGTVGIPDFLFALRTYPGQQFGRPCAFEVKMPTGKLSDEQARCIARMTDNGWDVRIIHSVSEALQALNEMGAKELV